MRGLGFKWAKFHWGLPILIYSPLVAFFHRDVLLNIGTKILAGWQVGGVVVWEGWWFRKSMLGPGKLDPFFSNIIFYPLGVPISMHSPLTTFYFLATKPFFNVYVAYNLFCVVSYVLAGWAMYLLAYHITRHKAASLFAGLVYMFNHESLTQHFLGQVGQANAFFVPLLYWSLIRLLESMKRAHWLLFTLVLQGVVLITPYSAFAHGFMGISVCLIVLLRKPDFRASRAKTLFFIGGSYLLAAVTGLLAYAPLFEHAKEFIGASESYSLHPLSFFVFPFWHENGFARLLVGGVFGHTEAAMKVTQGIFGPARMVVQGTPENHMGFVTYTVLLILGLGLVRKAFKGQALWWWLVLIGGILSLGSYLELAHGRWQIPLPYLIFEKLPFLGQFRAPARIIEVAWVGVAVLVAISISTLGKNIKNKCIGGSVLAGAALVFMWEMGVVTAAQRVTPLQNVSLYRLIHDDKDEFGVLELPVAIGKYGDITINAQLFMLNQPLHEKPLVVARPSRHTWQSLTFCEGTDFVYELTHPHAILSLTRDRALSGRLKYLLENGRRILRDHHIKYLVFHHDEEFFPLEVRRAYLVLLSEALGSPLKVGDEGALLYRVYQ